MIRRLLCKLGFHKWKYNDTYDKRWCECGKTQEKFFSHLWAECIDGEPIEDFTTEERKLENFSSKMNFI